MVGYSCAGSKAIRIVRHLGVCSYDVPQKELHVTRHYYHVQTDTDRDDFTHVVKGHDEDDGWIYRYTWIDICSARPAPALFGHLGAHLSQVWPHTNGGRLHG